MSILFGVYRWEGHAVEERELIELAGATRRFAPDGTFVRASSGIGMGFQPHHTHQRSNLESHPLVDEWGNMLTFDGRLDNHTELCALLDIRDYETADSWIVLTAFKCWGEGCFSKFIGDWAIALWSSSERSLYLARDHSGTRTLFFENDGKHIRWSTYLESFFVYQSQRPLCEQYLAHYLGSIPLRDLTPYRDLRGVPPAHYLAIRRGGIVATRYWEVMTERHFHYSSDLDYEQHFLLLFKQSVERRTGPGAPILAQLSGGMDSSAIVCTSDFIRRSHSRPLDLLDTISFYDDTEPNWNERPYFSRVEAARGKIGIHLPTSFVYRSYCPPEHSDNFHLLPGADSSACATERKLRDQFGGQDYRTLLSGIGGDELLGGMPTPLPDLADHLLRGNICTLLSRSIPWCLANRTSVIRLLFETATFAFDLNGKNHVNQHMLPPWFRSRLTDLLVDLERQLGAGQSFAGLSARTISNGFAWNGLLETLPHLVPGLLYRYEYRYPYLDRNLVEFLHGIPREQLVRPNQRRSLMRRSLAGIVPKEILDRPRKAYLIHAPIASLQRARQTLDGLFANSLLEEYGFVDGKIFRSSLDSLMRGQDLKQLHAVLRTISSELWLRTNLGKAIHLPLKAQLPCSDSQHLRHALYCPNRS